MHRKYSSERQEGVTSLFPIHLTQSTVYELVFSLLGLLFQPGKGGSSHTKRCHVPSNQQTSWPTVSRMASVWDTTVTGSMGSTLYSLFQWWKVGYRVIQMLMGWRCTWFRCIPLKQILLVIIMCKSFKQQNEINVANCWRKITTAVLTSLEYSQVFNWNCKITGKNKDIKMGRDRHLWKCNTLYKQNKNMMRE